MTEVRVYHFRNTFFWSVLVIGLQAVWGHAGTFYISPGGNDSSGDGSLSRPWRTAARAFSRGGGQTYIFRDGVYDYPGGTIDNPPSGTADGPTRVIAENDGRAVIDGGGSRTGIYIFSNPSGGVPTRQYITVEGFRVRHCGENPPVQVSSQDGTPLSGQTNNIVIRRVGASGDVQSTNNNVWEISRTRDSVFEDIWGWRYGRYVIDVYGCTNVTVRRGVFRWDGWGTGADKQGDPKFVMGVYDTHKSVFENLLLLDAAPTALPGDKGGIYLPGNANGNTAPYTDSDNNSFLGLIVLNNAGHGVAVEGGSGGANDNNRFVHLVSWGNSSYGVTVPRKALNTSFRHVTLARNDYGSYFGGGDNGVSGTTLTDSVVYANAKAGVNGAVSASYNNVFGNGANYAGSASAGINSLSQDPAFKHLARTDNPSPNKATASDGTDRGATVVKRYVNGAQTNEDLWPWPFQARIKADMCEGVSRGFCGAATLTDYVWGFLGSPNPFPEFPDDGRPVIKSVQAGNPSYVDIEFSERMDPASAQDIGNYTVDRGVAVLRTALDAGQTTVRLTVSPPLGDGTYALTVNNVRDQDQTSQAVFGGTVVRFSLTQDLAPPRVTGVRAGPTSIDVSFSEPVDARLAETIVNYTVSGGVTVRGATLDADQQTVHLSVSPQVPGAAYTLGIRHLRDTAAPPNTIPADTAVRYTVSLQDEGPTIQSVKPVSATVLDVVFNGSIDRATAQSRSNYAVSRGVVVRSASLDADQRTVHLTVTPQRVDVPYTLTVNNVRDRAARRIAPNSSVEYQVPRGVPLPEGSDPLKPAQKFVTPGAAEGAVIQFGNDAVDVTIRDAAGNPVVHKTKTGAENIVWDGRDEQGRVVESGAYISQIKGSSGRVVYFPIAVVK